MTPTAANDKKNDIIFFMVSSFFAKQVGLLNRLQGIWRPSVFTNCKSQATRETGDTGL
jgi:hypothetical protein